MKSIVVGIVFALSAQVLVGQPAPHVPQGIVSDWTHHHVLYPDSKDDSAMARVRSDPRWVQNWYLRHREAWWPKHPRRHRERSHRDWSVPLGTTAFEPLFDFTFTIGSDTGYGSLGTTYIGTGEFLAVAGTVTVTGTANGQGVGTYPLYPGGPAQTTSPSGRFLYDDVLYPSADPVIDNNGPLFRDSSGFEINIWSNGADSYEFDESNGGGYINDNTGSPFTLNANADPGGGQTFPGKFVYDVTAAPSCTTDFVVMGIPANPVSGGQANIIGLNNLYSGGAGALCSTGPTVMFAYAENLSTGNSYFHVLTFGTTGTNGSSATAAVVPGSAGGNNAVDQTVLLSPDGGITNQGSTNSVFVVFTSDDDDDVAYATTYSTAGSGSGYLYKISNVFSRSAAPTIAWSVPINAVPSTPVYDWVSNKVFFTDSNGRIDYVTDTGPSPSVVYGAVVASGATSENAVIVDSTNQMVYASFNSNGSNAIVVQAPTSMASSVSVPVGTGSTIYTGP